jgi:arsenate reductase
VLRGRPRVGHPLLLNDPVDRDLVRRASAEAVGTAFLVAIVVGSGIAAQRMSPGNAGLQLLENSIATGAGLIALILAIGPISGAHLNPVVTLADRVLGGTTTRELGWYAGAQFTGACVGVMVANVMFELAPVELSTHTRSSPALWLGEFVATFGLLMVILGVVRAGRSQVAAFAVGGYIAAAYWFTSSTSFANPAVTVGRTLTDTFAGIRPSSAPMFIVMQVLGGLAAVALAHFWNPHIPAADLVMPHEAPTPDPSEGTP